MGPILAESVAGPRALWLGGLLILAVAASAIECEPRPARQRAPVVEPTCTHGVRPQPAPGPQHVYVDVGPTVAPRFDERVRAVAALTIAERRPEWQLHFADEPVGGKRAPGWRLEVAVERLSRRGRVVTCAARLRVSAFPAARRAAPALVGQPARATVTIDAAASAAAIQLAEDACVTTAVEAAVIDRIH